MNMNSSHPELPLPPSHASTVVKYMATQFQPLAMSFIYVGSNLWYLLLALPI
jgi:hypothetical protein